MPIISVVYNGACARDGAVYYHSRSMAEFLKGLTREYDTVRYFGGYFEPGDADYGFVHEQELVDPGLLLFLTRANSANTSSLNFVCNYYRALLRVIGFVYTSEHVVVFLPSFLSVVAALLAVCFGKKLAVYIGGNWGVESQHRRLNVARALAYPVNRYLVDPLVYWLARRARYAVTPGYDLYAELHSQGVRVYLPVPLVNINRQTIVWREDTCQHRPFRVLFVGALRYAKGVTVLLEAVGRLKQRADLADLQLWLVGTGEMEATLRQQAETSGIAADVVFFGHVANGPALFDLYRQADAFVLPTFSEGFPRVLYEAMAFGLPIITTTVGGIPYFLHAGQEALLIPPQAVAQLEDAIATLLSTPTLRQNIIRNARTLLVDVIFARIEKEVSLAQQVRRYFDETVES